MATTLNKEFDKVEQKYKEEHPEEFADEESDEREYIFQGERDEKSALDSSYAASRKELGELAKEMENSEDEVKAPEDPDSKKKNRITKYYDEERSKLKDMTGIPFVKIFSENTMCT